jgi:hypothetical protein
MLELTDLKCIPLPPELVAMIWKYYKWDHCSSALNEMLFFRDYNEYYVEPDYRDTFYYQEELRRTYGYGRIVSFFFNMSWGTFRSLGMEHALFFIDDMFVGEIISRLDDDQFTVLSIWSPFGRWADLIGLSHKDACNLVKTQLVNIRLSLFYPCPYAFVRTR